MEHDPEIVHEFAMHLLDEQVCDGCGPGRPRPWLAAAKLRIMRELSPEYVARCVAGLRAKKRGRRLTGWREVRGSHQVTHVRDPFGTDKPPWV